MNEGSFQTKGVDPRFMRHPCRFLLASLIGVSTLAACRPGHGTPSSSTAALADSSEKSAEHAAETWLALIDHACYEMSWDSGGKTLQHAITKANWRDALLEARAPFGPLGPRRLLDRQHALPQTPPEVYVVFRYVSTAADGRRVVETVVPALENGRWRVTGYFVRPE